MLETLLLLVLSQPLSWSVSRSAMLYTWKAVHSCYLVLCTEPDGTTSTAPLLLPGYFSPRSSQCIWWCFKGMPWSFVEATLLDWQIVMTLYITVSALRAGRGCNVETTVSWALHWRFRFHHVRGLHFFLKHLLICVCAQIQELALFFHYMGSGDQTQVSGLVASTCIHWVRSLALGKTFLL